MNNLKRRLTPEDIINRAERRPLRSEIEEDQIINEAMRKYHEAAYRREERYGLLRLIFWTAVIVGICGLILWAIFGA